MENQKSLTAVDVAELLKITKNTVYEMVKRGELPGYKVGKKLRIDKADVENYINNQKMPLKYSNPLVLNNEVAQKETKNNILKFESNNDIIISGQDVILDILAESIRAKVNDIRVLRSNTGSYAGLYDLYNDKISAASAHLWDGDTGEYNLAFVRKMMPGIPCLIINLAYRNVGFYVAKGNPYNINSWSDLVNPNISMINREKGSGIRILLDEKLRAAKIPNEQINGYNTEKQSHFAVARSIARGEGDVGIGNEKIAKQVEEIDFIKLQEERYDLVIKEADLKYSIYQLIVNTVQSEEFKKEIQSLGGYDLKDSGKILAKT
ncbi:putative molybdopterin biosynthesis protein [Clostridium saccharoperbutylacetonicum]|uniref:DNA-binding protein, excisionase family n=1 Tax=Clostridium saccharoperbutylacetonicum N1-4(HMT) TaxID=931276 RepID=M1MKM7_9CLOT|nr:helix-turn-helix transcriptional regulator [Clostridium saccharoperbutylacetonicum]AGF56833.1 DNA-binding protein, excisionase family [Clostridium saccharoperbutylacetonicum N1-4(HMT)]NRT62410.1 putative molybdopterin biosynthesis protein [Clostridium saccharoperbutylacetonicum]NSB25750.1 putative molybdopterin biosynthesis protein [Clostridium saccharoperbutylacetonicum]NSB45116.1 putative molybdopterin biosynthesis protein [Clostridium saccharoperbutylacetonicum]